MKAKLTGTKPTKKSKAKADKTFPLIELVGADRMRRATGVSDPFLQSRWLSQANGPLARGSDGSAESVLSTIAALEGIAPTDGIEGLLATQMVATHEAAIDCLRRASIQEQTWAGRDLDLKHGEKLLQIFTRQLEVMDKRRGLGQQKITVERVTVEAGGQAIVGTLQSPSAPMATAKSEPLMISAQSADSTPLPDPIGEHEKREKMAVRTRGL